MERHDGVVVRGRRVDEVHDDARFLARVAARDAADPLLVDALRSGRGEVHADGRARRVPALGEQLRVDEHVDLAALVAGEDPRQLALRRLAGNRLRLDARVLERLRDVVRVLDAGRVDDTGQVLEAHAIEVRHGGVERALVEEGGQLFLVEVLVHLALSQRDVRDRADADPGRDAHAAQRGDHAAPGRLREVEARRLRREEVGHVTGDQRARGRHADEDRAEPVADRGARLLAEGGVRLVADDDRVRVRDVARVADEPLVGLDRDRAVGARLLVVLQQRRARALLVAALVELAVELVHEVAPVRKDQDPARPRGVDEAHGGNRLAGARGVLEPEPARRAGVLGLLGKLLVLVNRVLLGVRIPVDGLVVLGDLLVALELLLARGELFDRRLAVAVAVRAAPLTVLDLGEKRDQRAGQGIDLVGVQRGAVREMRLVLGEEPLEAEHQRVLASPLHRRRVAARLDLGEGVVERAAARGSLGEDLIARLTLVHELLEGELLRAPKIVVGDRRLRRY